MIQFNKLLAALLLLGSCIALHAADTLYVTAPKRVAVGNQFKVSFTYKSDKDVKLKVLWEANEELAAYSAQRVPGVAEYSVPG